MSTARFPKLTTLAAHRPQPAAFRERGLLADRGREDLAQAAGTRLLRQRGPIGEATARGRSPRQRRSDGARHRNGCERRAAHRRRHPGHSPDAPALHRRPRDRGCRPHQRRTGSAATTTTRSAPPTSLLRLSFSSPCWRTLLASSPVPTSPRLPRPRSRRPIREHPPFRRRQRPHRTRTDLRSPAPPRRDRALVPPISLVLASQPKDYAAGLGAYSQGNLGSWCGQFADATTRAAGKAEHLAQRIEGLQDAWLERLHRPRKDAQPPANSSAPFPAQPIIDVPAAQQLTGESHVAMGDDGQLEQAGMPQELSTSAKWGRVWRSGACWHSFERVRGNVSTP